jgi:hypothetical protein
MLLKFGFIPLESESYLVFGILPNLTITVIRHRESLSKNPLYLTRDLVKFKLVGVGILKIQKFFFFISLKMNSRAFGGTFIFSHTNFDLENFFKFFLTF